MIILYFLVGFVAGFSAATLIFGDDNGKKNTINGRKTGTGTASSKPISGRRSLKASLPNTIKGRKARGGKTVQANNKDSLSSRKTVKRQKRQEPKRVKKEGTK